MSSYIKSVHKKEGKQCKWGWKGGILEMEGMEWGERLEIGIFGLREGLELSYIFELGDKSLST